MTAKSELRQNPVSGDWVLISTSRGKRPHAFSSNKDVETPLEACPFEDPQKTNGVDALLWYSKNGKEVKSIADDWLLQVIPNKFPLVTSHKGACPIPPTDGLTRSMAAIGFHELIIPRKHSLFLSDMTAQEAELFVRAYQDRILAHKDEDCLQYVLVFHNHGSSAGASVWHPHSQILALPFIPHDVRRSLEGSKNWFSKKGTCVHCEIIASELESGERMVYENKHFVVFTPYAPSSSYELRLFPKAHVAKFEDIKDDERMAFADALVEALTRLKRGLENPAYNFFIHTAPVDREDYRYYHWHVEIEPKTSHLAGFELGLGVRTVTIIPEEAAVLLREAK